jgi:CRISPR-associated protein Cas6
METSFDIVYPVLCPKWDKTSTTYDLFGALSRVVPEIHKQIDVTKVVPETDPKTHEIKLVSKTVQEPNVVRIFPLVGQKNNFLPPKDIRIRVPMSLIEKIGSLENKEFKVQNSLFSLGSPIVYNLLPSSVLISDIVTIKFSQKKSYSFREFVLEVQKFLKEMDIRCRVHVFPEKKIAMMKNIAITGYPVMVSQLLPEQSLLLQYKGIGGRGHVGCGIFKNPNQLN